MSEITSLFIQKKLPFYGQKTLNKLLRSEVHSFDVFCIKKN